MLRNEQMGSGGVNMEMGCEKKINPGPAQTTSSSTSVQHPSSKTRVFYLWIPGLSSKTHNMKSVEH